MAKVCIECGDPIIGRQDKKFCSANCRSSYNNRKNSDITSFIRNVNSILRKNRSILAKLNPTGKTKVSREELLAEGFRFAYFTNEYVTKSGGIYRFCYDHGYIQLDNDIFALVIRKEYVD